MSEFSEFDYIVDHMGIPQDAEMVIQPKSAGPRLERRTAVISLPSPYDAFAFTAWVNAPAKLWSGLQPAPAPSDEDVEGELGMELDEATAQQVKAARERIVARNEAKLLGILGQLIISHNGWSDFDGSPLPPPSEAAFYESIPTELLGAMIAQMQAVQKKLPASLKKRRRR